MPYFPASAITGPAHSWPGRILPGRLDLAGIFFQGAGREGFSAAPFVASRVACRFSIAWPYPPIRASLSCLQEIRRHRPADIPPFSLLIPGGGHIDVQAVLAGADTEAVDLETVPNRHIWRKPEGSPSGQSGVPLHPASSPRRPGLRLHGFMVGLTHIEKSSFLLK